MQNVKKKRKAGPRHDFSPYMQQKLMAKTQHFNEGAAHRPEVRFYPIHSSVSAGDKHRIGGSGGKPAKSAILDDTFGQNLWPRRAKHEIIVQKNTVNHDDFRSSSRERCRSSKSSENTLLWDTKKHQWEAHKHRNKQKHVVFTTRDNEKRRVFWPQMVPHLRLQMVSNGAKRRKVQKSTKHWPIVEA